MNFNHSMSDAMAFYLKCTMLPTNLKYDTLRKEKTEDYQYLFSLSQTLLLSLSDNNGILYRPTEREIAWVPDRKVSSIHTVSPLKDNTGRGTANDYSLGCFCFSFSHIKMPPATHSMEDRLM